METVGEVVTTYSNTVGAQESTATATAILNRKFCSILNVCTGLALIISIVQSCNEICFGQTDRQDRLDRQDGLDGQDCQLQTQTDRQHRRTDNTDGQTTQTDSRPLNFVICGEDYAGSSESSLTDGNQLCTVHVLLNAQPTIVFCQFPEYASRVPNTTDARMGAYRPYIPE